MKNCRLIIASPTCGKTTLAHELVARGAAVVETDSLIQFLIPGWQARGEKSLWRLPVHDPERVRVAAQIDERIGVRVGKLLARNPNAVAISNLWSEDFAMYVRRTAEVIGSDCGVIDRGAETAELIKGRRFAFRVCVARSDPAEVVFLSRSQRKVGINFDLAQRWTTMWKAELPRAAENLVWIDSPRTLTEMREDGFARVFDAFDPSVERQPTVQGWDVPEVDVYSKYVSDPLDGLGMHFSGLLPDALDAVLPVPESSMQMGMSRMAIIAQQAPSSQLFLSNLVHVKYPFLLDEDALDNVRTSSNSVV